MPSAAAAGNGLASMIACHSSKVRVITGMSSPVRSSMAACNCDATVPTRPAGTDGSTMLPLWT